MYWESKNNQRICLQLPIRFRRLSSIETHLQLLMWTENKPCCTYLDVKCMNTIGEETGVLQEKFYHDFIVMNTLTFFSSEAYRVVLYLEISSRGSGAGSIKVEWCYSVSYARKILQTSVWSSIEYNSAVIHLSCTTYIMIINIPRSWLHFILSHILPIAAAAFNLWNFYLKEKETYFE